MAKNIVVSLIKNFRELNTHINFMQEHLEQ